MEYSSQIEEKTKQNPFINNSLLEALNPILKLKKFSGRSTCWPSKDHTKYVRWANIVTDIIITIFTISYSIHCTHFFSHTGSNMGQLLIGLVFTFFYFGASLLCIINLIVRLTSDRDLIKEVHAYRMMSGYDVIAHLEKAHFQLFWVLLISLIIVIGIISTLFLMSVFPKESVLVRILMFSHHDGIEFSVGVIIFALVSFFIGIGQLADFWILAFFCRIFRREFRFLRTKWLLPQSKTSNEIETRWHQEIDAFRREYEQVASLVKLVDHTFRFDLLLYFGVIIPITCVFIYAILQSEEIETSDLVVIQIMTCVTVIQSGFLIFVGIKINSTVSMKIIFISFLFFFLFQTRIAS